MKNNINQVLNCWGCYACEVVCPKKCIKSSENSQGFRFPVASDKNCVNCGRCLDVCATEKVYGRRPIKIFGARNKSNDVLQNSTSGGAFTAISDEIIERGGIVVGAVYDSNYKVVHICTDRKEIRDRMCGAKYVKSDIAHIYFEIKEYLLQNKYVLFSGTPCQVAAIKSYVNSQNIPTEKLITVDIICHGTPNPKIFEDYLNILQRKYGKLKSYKFRDKMIGWHGQNVVAGFEKGNCISKGFVKTFSSLYFGGYISMDSCHKCKYSSMLRVGDITLGDYWGVEKHFSEFSDNRGVSLVMLNSEAGIKLFSSIKESLIHWQVQPEQCMQQNLISPCNANKHKAAFNKIYHIFGYNFAFKITKIWKFSDSVTVKLSLILSKIFNKKNR